jgi:hypothetical protein
VDRLLEFKDQSGLLESSLEADNVLIGDDGRLNRPASFKGDRLEIHVKKEGGIGDFAVILGEVRRNGKVIASGTIKLWMPEMH